jgi:hypothetical protein
VTDHLAAGESAIAHKKSRHSRTPSEELAHNGLASGSALGKFVLCLAPPLGGLCASKSVARNEGAGEPIFPAWSWGTAPLRANQRWTGSVNVALLELGLLLPFVHLAHWDITEGDGVDGWGDLVC